MGLFCCSHCRFVDLSLMHEKHTENNTVRAWTSNVRSAVVAASESTHLCTSPSRARRPRRTIARRAACTAIPSDRTVDRASDVDDREEAERQASPGVQTRNFEHTMAATRCVRTCTRIMCTTKVCHANMRTCTGRGQLGTAPTGTRAGRASCCAASILFAAAGCCLQSWPHACARSRPGYRSRGLT